jgi:hypothetical protein
MKDDESELIKLYTGKTIGEVLNDFTLPELMRLNAFLIFMQFLI